MSAEAKRTGDEQWLPASDTDGSVERSSSPSRQTQPYRDGIKLIPRPSDDPRDPLNWSMKKKIPIVAALCLATFAGFSASLAGQLIPGPQALLYGVTKTQMAYQNSMSNAGFGLGGFIFFPLSHKFGRSSAIFWSLVGSMTCQIWSARMVSPNEYNAFLASRFFSAFFGTVTAILGPRVLVDLFFLHQRGRAFTAFHFFFDLGTVIGPTIGAFVASEKVWMNAYWFSFALVTFALLTCSLFLHETTWDRTPGAMNPDPTPKGFLANRVASFFPGTQVTPHASFVDILEAGTKPFIVLVTPVTVILGVFCLISFGFYVAMNSLTPVWLQKANSLGGYGFTARENAIFSFAHWIGIAIAWIYGHLVSDRLPLAICARRRGVWKPEYRLHALWVPALIFNPVGLGLFGAALKHQWHWAVLAIAQVMVTFGSLSITPITVNYASEIFTGNPAETAIALNLYRVGFGLSVAFYINPWVELMGFQWAYGMMACLEVFSFLFVLLLMWKGHEIRKWNVGGLLKSEEGEHLIEEKHGEL